MKHQIRHIILCNDAQLPQKFGMRKEDVIIELKHTSKDKNIDINIPDFVTRLYHIPDRIKDLLEIAAYIYSADRKVLRGTLHDVEYQSWDRHFHFIFKVRDLKFWSSAEVKKSLSDALCFMSGDNTFDFTFLNSSKDFPFNLFDSEQFKLCENTKTHILLFSGGLDSLAGAIDCLENNKTDKICLISHLSGNPSTKKTQDKLFESLQRDYPGRCFHFQFECSLKGKRAVEETQRTRSFLYSTIAFALADAYSQNKFLYYENGVTSINFLKREDLINSRASRTTHPKTIALMQTFFKLVYEKDIKIEHPFLYHTKTDIFNVFKIFNRQNYISSSVSCSRTFQNKTQASHCGVCSQCIDRRFAAFASELNEFDDLGIYDFDFILENIEDGKAKTTLIDYIRLALEFSKMSDDMFYHEKLDELVDIIDYIEGKNEPEKVDAIYQMCIKHGSQIEKAINNMLKKYYRPFKQLHPKSLLKIVLNEEHLKKSETGLIEIICSKLNVAIPLMFQKNPPKNENDFNDKVQALIAAEENNYRREFPNITFALSRITPDHEFADFDLLIESKYIRNSTTPSVASEGIAADLTKYPEEKHKLFIVYDPHRQISNDFEFKDDFERKGNCTVYIIR